MRTKLPVLLLIAAPFLAQGAQGQGADKKPDLPALFSALKTAPTTADAMVLEAEISEVWLNAGTGTVHLLMARAMREMGAGEYKDAVDDFGAAIDLQPDLPEPWERRAVARYHQGDVTGAVNDLAEALKREPRHFGALRLLSAIAEERGDWKGAYESWQKLLAIDPKAPGGEDRLKMLQLKALGQEL